MDFDRSPNDLDFDFDGPVRGICPKGWHLPQYEETWEMVDSLYNKCCADIDPYPPLKINNLYGGENLPLRDMFLESCYDSYTNPQYSEEVYDATHLSLLRRAPVKNASNQFWIANCPGGGYVAYVFCCYEGKEGINISYIPRSNQYKFVRCVRGNAE